MKRNYIGLACTGHDNAIAIVNSEGKVVFAEATERHHQNKRAINTPPDDMIRIEEIIQEYCDDDAELVIAKTWSEHHLTIFKEETRLAQLRHAKYSQNEETQFLSENANIYDYVMSFVSNNVENSGKHLKFRCDTSIPHNTIFKHYDHHLTHAATGCYTSPFSEAVCVVVDGFGEGSSTAIYQYKDNQLERIHINKMQGNIEKSLGVFYGTLCGLCGFDIWRGEEWKVMGLAPYGKFNQDIYDLMQQRFQVKNFDFICPDSGNEALTDLLSHARKPTQDALFIADLAHTGQQFFCDKLTELLENVHDLSLSKNLVLSGGCALNSAYNGKILALTNFENLHVYSAPGDDGNALGAALLAFNDDQPNRIQPSLQTPYLGSNIKEETLDNIKAFSQLPYIQTNSTNIIKIAAKMLSEQKIIGWVQGNAEFGPRALGNRSILADPSSPLMKDKINSRVKFREEFRPFAPSILHNHGDQYFHNYQDSPYMERTLAFRKTVTKRVPAVVHIDGTGRLQSVRKDWNPKYHALIEEFFELTGIPLLLNTSFNVMGKPIIHSAEDALTVFHTSGLDAIFIENTIFIKGSSYHQEILDSVAERNVELSQ